MPSVYAALATAALAAESPPPDGWVTAKAKLTLLNQPGLKGSQVHVDTNDGVVTLYGKVSDASRRQGAERAVRAIDGVRGVENLLQIVPAAQERAVRRADADLAEVVDRMLREDPALEGSRIRVKSVDKGVVLLAGRARTFSDRLRAVSSVDQLAGVRRVVSRIEGPEGYGKDERNLSAEGPFAARSSLTDTRITTEVKLRLLGAPELPGLEVNVDTRDGVVTLFGTVPDDAGKSRAEAEALEVAGVTRVRNQLEIVPVAARPAAAASDAQVERALRARLSAHRSFAGVRLEVKHGTVRLTGTVSTVWQKLQVMRLSRATPGVKALHDELVVSPP